MKGIPIFTATINHWGLDMFRANFLFSFSAERSNALQLEVDAVPVRTTEGLPQQMKLTFAIGGTGMVTTALHVGFLQDYHPWSESPLSLLLRAVHLLRAEWSSSIPEELISRPVLDLDLFVAHLTSEGATGSQLASLSLKKIGHDDRYTLTQTLPNRALFPMSIDAESAAPLGVALKTLVQVQVEAVDLHNHPVAVKVPAFIDESGRRNLLREQLPYYAVTAFDAYSAAFASNYGDNAARLRSESLVQADEWANFLAA